MRLSDLLCLLEREALSAPARELVARLRELLVGTDAPPPRGVDVRASIYATAQQQRVKAAAKRSHALERLRESLGLCGEVNNVMVHAALTAHSDALLLEREATCLESFLEREGAA